MSMAATFDGGFLREDGALVVSVDTNGSWDSGFLRDANGALIVTEAAGGTMQNGFVRDAAGRLAITEGGFGTWSGGALRDSDGRLVVSNGAVTGSVNGAGVDSAGRIVMSGLPTAAAALEQGAFRFRADDSQTLNAAFPSSGSLVNGEPAAATPYAAASYEDQTVGDMNIVQAYPGDLTFPSGGAAQGTYFGRYKVREGFNEPQTGSERCESVKGEVPTLKTYITRAWMRIPADSEFNEWLTTIQWKTTDESGGAPPLDLFLLPPAYRGDEYLSLRAGDSSVVAWDSASLVREKWYRIVVKSFMHPDPAQGWVEVWFGDANGVTQQTMTDGGTRFFMRTAVASSTHHFRFGIRRADVNTGTTIVDYDDLSIEEVV